MVSRVSKRGSTGISGKFQKCFKGVPRKCQGGSKKDFRVLQGTFNGVPRNIEGCFNGVLVGYKGV